MEGGHLASTTGIKLTVAEGQLKLPFVKGRLFLSTGVTQAGGWAGPRRGA